MNSKAQQPTQTSPFDMDPKVLPHLAVLRRCLGCPDTTECNEMLWKAIVKWPSLFKSKDNLPGTEIFKIRDGSHERRLIDMVTAFGDKYGTIFWSSHPAASDKRDLTYAEHKEKILYLLRLTYRRLDDDRKARVEDELKSASASENPGQVASTSSQTPGLSAGRTDDKAKMSSDPSRLRACTFEPTETLPNEILRNDDEIHNTREGAATRESSVPRAPEAPMTDSNAQAPEPETPPTPVKGRAKRTATRIGKAKSTTKRKRQEEVCTTTTPASGDGGGNAGTAESPKRRASARTRTPRHQQDFLLGDDALAHADSAPEVEGNEGDKQRSTQNPSSRIPDSEVEPISEAQFAAESQLNHVRRQSSLKSRDEAPPAPAGSEPAGSSERDSKPATSAKARDDASRNSVAREDQLANIDTDLLYEVHLPRVYPTKVNKRLLRMAGSFSEMLLEDFTSRLTHELFVHYSVDRPFSELDLTINVSDHQTGGLVISGDESLFAELRSSYRELLKQAVKDVGSTDVAQFCTIKVIIKPAWE